MTDTVNIISGDRRDLNRGGPGIATIVDSTQKKLGESERRKGHWIVSDNEEG
jgi:hypothetical protein